ncbi:MAG: LemA family protein [Candidatus Melainabacteria bacterium RIFOXYA12_FULL_32_12]|nr:MAG: LemA family protein [Candidatus Melainabacteria bacterium RIFOXYA2_FULL_32_9]OGI30450.1 MAG: LemA family protein [Candidatus Melainabacteria bacterium RIFOXYA12_FULL_32_12]
MKNKSLIALLLVIILLFFVVGSFFGTYNELQVLDESVNSNWAQVENQLQRRSDLIPNLVNTVKGYASHEKEIFTSVAESRSKLSGAMHKGSVQDITKANAQFTGALSRLLAVVENYPQLKADRSFLSLQDELAGTENRLAVARRDYNETVKTLNAKTRMIPTSIVANMIGIKARDYFQVEEVKKEIPQVKF